MITCYILQRHKKSSLCLSPYLDTERVANYAEDEQVVLKSSGMLTKNQRDEVSYSLYAAIDFSVDRWIQNKQYVPRLLVCAVVFTVAYFFFSLVIRDPIPMLDELVISSALTIFCWTFLSKRDTRSSVAQRRRYELKLRASEREEVIEEGLFSLEQYLDEIGQLDPLQVCNSLCLVEPEAVKPDFASQLGENLVEIRAMLVQDLTLHDKQILHTAHRIVELRAHQKPDEKLAAKLFHLSAQDQIDLALLSCTVALLQQ